ncbi:MAG: flagellar biosynthesis anti-sigma factor FlgM [Thermodesulfobacteriota bacterium]
MKLTGVFPQIKTDNKIQAKRSEGAAAAKAASAGTPVGADRVQLSTGTQDVQKAQEILQQTPAVRAERVAALKEQIERGEYEIDPYRVADKMLYALVSDNIVGE